MEKPQFGQVEAEIDQKQQKFPYCLVWTALPCITCLFPCVGHLGICKSDGTIYDFLGRGPIHQDQLGFGNALKYLRLDNSDIKDEEWDQAIESASQQFCKTDHNICVNNCHHHVARALNIMEYKGKSNWSQVDLAVMITFKANHLGVKALCIYLLPIILLIVFLIVKLL